MWIKIANGKYSQVGGSTWLYTMEYPASSGTWVITTGNHNFDHETTFSSQAEADAALLKVLRAEGLYEH